MSNEEKHYFRVVGFEQELVKRHNPNDRETTLNVPTGWMTAAIAFGDILGSMYFDKESASGKALLEQGLLDHTKHESGCREIREGVYEIDIAQARKGVAKPDDPEIAHATAVMVMADMRDRLDNMRMVQKKMVEQIKLGIAAKNQIGILAKYILEGVTGEPSKDEGAGECAVRLLKEKRQLFPQIEELNEVCNELEKSNVESSKVINGTKKLCEEYRDRGNISMFYDKVVFQVFGRGEIKPEVKPSREKNETRPFETDMM